MSDWVSTADRINVYHSINNTHKQSIHSSCHSIEYCVCVCVCVRSLPCLSQVSSLLPPFLPPLPLSSPSLSLSL